MVKIKGREISNKLANNSILAMKELIRRYTLGEYSENVCPLCPLHSGCDHCPWRIINNSGCEGYNFNDVVSDKKRTKKRIRQLRRWIKVYEEELNVSKK